MQPQVTIARVIGRGWKVGNFNVALEPRTLLVGPNGSGKSAVLEAIRVSVLGFIPALGKRLQDTAALMVGRSADVALHLSDGRVVSWAIDRSARGALSSRVSCSWLPDGATQQEHATAVLELVAEDETTVAEILDARTLLKATPRERTQRIQGFIAAATMQPEERRSMAGELAVRKLAGAVDRAVPAESCYGMIPGTDAGGEHFGERRAFDGAVDAFLSHADESSAAAIEWARLSKNDAARNAREKKAARDALAARVEDLPDVDPFDLAEDRERLTELRRLASVEEYKLERQVAQAKARDRAAGELSEAKRKYLEAEAQAIDADHAAKSIPDLEAELGAARAWLDGAAEPTLTVPEEVGQLERGMERLTRDMIRCAREADEIVLPDVDESERDEAQRRLDNLERDLEEAKADPWARVRELCATINANAKCQALALEALAQLEALAAEHGGADPVRLAFEIEAAAKALLDAQNRVCEARKARGEAMGRKHALNDEWQAAKDGLEAAKERRDQLAGPVENDHLKAVAEYRRRREDQLARIGGLERRIEELRRNAFNAAQAKALASNRVVTAQRVLEDLGDGDESEVEDYSEQIALLSESIEKRAAILAERDGLERLGDELRDAGALRDVFAALEWAAQQVQSEEVRRSGAALREPMAEILGRDVYLEPGKTSCEIGWLDDAGNRVSVEALSGGQFAFFLAALQAAIIDLRGGALRLVIVEAGECDDATLANLEAGLAGWNGQVVGARWLAPPLAGGWSFVEM